MASLQLTFRTADTRVGVELLGLAYPVDVLVFSTVVILFVDYCGWFGGGEFGSGAELTASRPRVLVKFVVCAPPYTGRLESSPQ